MSDEGFDPCECMWSHEMAMRRLLSLLRQSQAYCTDTECLEELPGSHPGTSTASSSFFLMMICWMTLAFVLYLLRPSTLRDQNDSKPRDNGSGPHGSPPAPPPAIN